MADVFGCAELVGWDDGALLVEIGFALGLEASGEDIARLDRIDGDVVASVFECGAAHEAQLSSLARAIMRPARKARDVPRDGRDDDDATVIARFHMGEGGLNHEKSAFQVDRMGLVPLGFRHVVEHGLWKDTGIRAHDVDLAVLFHHSIEYLLALCLIGYIEAKKGAFDVLCGLFPLGLVNIGDDDVGPCFGQGGGDAAPDAAGSTGYDCYPIVEFKHGILRVVEEAKGSARSSARRPWERRVAPFEMQ